LLDGRVGSSTLSLKKFESGIADFALEIRMIDPLNRIKSVAFHYAPRQGAKLPTKPDSEGNWEPLAGAKRVDLELNQSKATATFSAEVPTVTAGPPLLIQISYVNGAGKTVYMQPSAQNVGNSLASRDVPGGGMATSRPRARGSADNDVMTLPPSRGGGKLDPFLAVAVETDAHVLFTAAPTGLLNHYSYPALVLQGAYKLAGPAYHLALDDNKGLLYAVVTEPGALKLRRSNPQPEGVANLHIYEVKDILQGKGVPGTQLAPAAEVALGANVPRMCLSPDGKWVFCLKREDGAEASSKLVRISTETRKADMELDFAPGTEAICLPRDGKTLYAVASPRGHSTRTTGPYEGQIQVVDPPTMEVRRVINVDADPYDIQATNDGIVYISGGSGQFTEVTVVETKKSRSVVGRWKGVYRGSSLRVSADQKRLYISTQNLSPPSVTSWMIPKNLADCPVVSGVLRDARDAPLGGDIFLTPDGQYLLSRFGAAVALGSNGSSSTSSKSKGGNSPAAKPRRLDP
jgi:hypothetical protein